MPNKPIQNLSILIQFAGYYAALEKGFYQNAGLQVKIEEALDYTESTDAI